RRTGLFFRELAPGDRLSGPADVFRAGRLPGGGKPVSNAELLGVLPAARSEILSRAFCSRIAFGPGGRPSSDDRGLVRVFLEFGILRLLPQRVRVFQGRSAGPVCRQSRAENGERVAMDDTVGIWMFHRAVRRDVFSGRAEIESIAGLYD